MKNYARIYTNKLVEMAEEGLITWESLAHACLGYMSEDDVKDMAQTEWDVDCETEEDEDEDVPSDD
jgi:hypothetical protein